LQTHDHLVLPHGGELVDLRLDWERKKQSRHLPTWDLTPRQVCDLELLLTGSGAGKSTIANILFIKFLEMGGRPVTLLDGDLVRKHLSSELGFSREHRDINIRRIEYVASEITKNRGIAICAPIAPYDVTRKEVRAMIDSLGGFIMVYVSTPVEICECP
jgi:sulfate adenylyltransferase